MIRPFAGPLFGAAKRRLSPSPRVSHFTGAAATKTALPARSDAQSTCGIAPPKVYFLSRSSSPLAAVRYGVAHLSSCATTSLIDHGRRLTDEAFRTRVGKLSAGSPGWLFHVFAPVALRSFAAGL